MTAPICVVVSAFDRSSLLPALIGGLKQQTLEGFEVVVVDNGSTDDTYEHLRQLTDGDARFKVLRIDDNRGPARARNLGWRATDREWIAFTDDDCVPEAGWLESLLVAASSADVVQGRTIANPDQPVTGWFDRSQRIERWSGRYQTCNLLVRRRLLEQLDGFDEGFPIAMGEDVDLGLRAEATGAATAFSSDAVVRHHVWRTGFRGYLQQRRRLAELVLLVRRNPAARRLFRFGVLHGATHLLIWVLAPVSLWALASGRPWIPGLLVLAWCSHQAWCTRDRPWPVGPRLVFSAVELVGRVYETWCYAAASVRYRRLVL